MSLEDPNDPQVRARKGRMAQATRMVHALQVHMAQNEFLQELGVTQMASNFTPTASEDVLTFAALQELFLGYGVTPPSLNDGG